MSCTDAKIETWFEGFFKAAETAGYTDAESVGQLFKLAIRLQLSHNKNFDKEAQLPEHTGQAFKPRDYWSLGPLSTLHEGLRGWSRKFRPNTPEAQQAWLDAEANRGKKYMEGSDAHRAWVETTTRASTLNDWLRLHQQRKNMNRLATQGEKATIANNTARQARSIPYNKVMSSNLMKQVGQTGGNIKALGGQYSQAMLQKLQDTYKRINGEVSALRQGAPFAGTPRPSPMAAPGAAPAPAAAPVRPPLRSYKPMGYVPGQGFSPYGRPYQPPPIEKVMKQIGSKA